jgi:hypothetical protein
MLALTTTTITQHDQVEYLKAQLASEQTLRTETEAALTLARTRTDSVRSEAAAALEAAEDSKRAAVTAANGRAQAAAEAAAGEAFALRGKLAQLQEQVGESLGSVALAKRHEESAKAEAAALAQVRLLLLLSSTHVATCRTVVSALICLAKSKCSGRKRACGTNASC